MPDKTQDQPRPLKGCQEWRDRAAKMLSEPALRETTGPLPVVGSGGVVGGHEPLSPELEECRKANEIAAEACEERQPMPNRGVSSQLVAEACELIGEGHAKNKHWSACANAHRMACWYYRKALAE